MNGRYIVIGVSTLVLIGAATYSLIAPAPESVFEQLEGAYEVEVVGEVVRAVDVRETHHRVSVRAESVNGFPVPKGNPLILVTADRYQSSVYGDTIRAVGTVRKPEPFETDTGRTFNYEKFLRTHGISHTLAFAHVDVLETGGGNPIVRWLLALKKLFIHGIERSLPEPHAALAAGLLLGEKQSLGDSLTDAFRVSGLIHIVVLSGYNVALVINAVLFVVLRFLPRVGAYALAAVFVVGFVIITGASETTVRAGLMALLMMVARVMNRPGDALNGLAVAAGVMAIWNPFVVLYDLSFQLSVIATLGLILFSDSFASRVRFIPERFGFREIIATTLATQVTVLPLLIFSIGMVSLVFLPANALVLPAVPLAMFTSFVSALFALVAPAFAAIVGAVPYAVLSYIIVLSEFFGKLPQGSIVVPPHATLPLLAVLLLVYAVVFFAVTRQSVSKSPRR